MILIELVFKIIIITNYYTRIFKIIDKYNCYNIRSKLLKHVDVYQ